MDINIYYFISSAWTIFVTNQTRIFYIYFKFQAYKSLLKDQFTLTYNKTNGNKNENYKWIFNLWKFIVIYC